MTKDVVAGDGREELARFLRERRGRLDPTACGFTRGRRRTPGLRREEVAQLAGVSVTWYTWLEQGREHMAVPSVQVLEGIATALRLDRAERDHLFLLAHGRLPPRSQASAAPVAIPPAVQRWVDDAHSVHPTLVRTADTWDIVAWNRAAVAVFGDYATLPAGDRNLLRWLFTGPAARAGMLDGDQDARHIVAALRSRWARVGPSEAVERLIAELSEESPVFARWWRGDRDVVGGADGIKRMHHPAVGALSLTYATLTPEAAEGLTVVVFSPVTSVDRMAIERLLSAPDAPARQTDV